MTEMKDRYIATMILHAVGDMIGFKNGLWEFNYFHKQSGSDIGIEILYEYLELGGITGIDFSTWRVSDDTLYHMAMARTLINNKNIKTIYDEFKSNLSLTHKKIQKLEKKGIKLYPGVTLTKYIEQFTSTQDGRSLPYDSRSIGSGAAMKANCIGLVFHGEHNRKTLIDIAIQSARLTHNSPYGYLGALGVALFTAYAIEGIHIHQWPFLFIKLLDDPIVKSYVDEKNYDNIMDYEDFVRRMYSYIDDRFVNGKPIKTKSQRHLQLRIQNYAAKFTLDEEPTSLGFDGLSALIIAYESVLDCNGKWETLIAYSIFHPGDSDTTGSIAGGLFGSLYGFTNVPENNYAHLEYRSELYELGNKLFAKYH